MSHAHVRQEMLNVEQIADQGHLLAGWDSLTEDQRARLTSDIQVGKLQYQRTQNPYNVLARSVRYPCSLPYLQAIDLAYVSRSYRASKAVAGMSAYIYISSFSLLGIVRKMKTRKLLVTADKSKKAPQPLQDVTKLKVT